MRVARIADARCGRRSTADSWTSAVLRPLSRPAIHRLPSIPIRHNEGRRAGRLDKSMNRITVDRRFPGFLTFLVLPFLVNGCATQPSHTGVPQLFELVDQRPGGEDSTEWLTRNGKSCDYTLRQIGDQDISPDRFTLLREGLSATVGRQLVGKTLLITRYAIYINSLKRDRTSAWGINGNVFSNLIEDVYYRHVDHRCQEEQLAQGRLEPADVESHRSPVIVEITLIVDGKTHSVRSLFTPNQDISIKEKDPGTQAAIQAALNKAIQQLIAEMLVT